MCGWGVKAASTDPYLDRKPHSGPEWGSHLIGFWCGKFDCDFIRIKLGMHGFETWLYLMCVMRGYYNITSAFGQNQRYNSEFNMLRNNVQFLSLSHIPP